MGLLRNRLCRQYACFASCGTAKEIQWLYTIYNTKKTIIKHTFKIIIL